MNAHRKILLVEKDRLIRQSLYELLRLEGYDAVAVSDGAEALQSLGRESYSVVVSDVRTPGLSSKQLLEHVQQHQLEAQVVLVTSYGTIESAVEAMRSGAFDYLTKPIIDGEFLAVIDKACNRQSTARDRLSVAPSPSDLDRFCGLVGRDSRMQQIYEMIGTIAATKATVLICGESGTGKRLIAKAIHQLDEQRSHQPFVEVSCGALPRDIMESELFGHVKGSFTSAVANRTGRFEQAEGGTIFLDEIDAFASVLQVKLLRVLQEREFERVGENQTIKVDVRIVAATNRDLTEEIRRGNFREDLYYRLHVICIDIPPLRDRVSDIPLLAGHFLDSHCEELGKSMDGFSDDAMNLMMAYQWPGNVRELENAIERAAIMCKGRLVTPQDLPSTLCEPVSRTTAGQHGFNGATSLKDALRGPERQIILEALERTNWNKKKAATLLRINRTTLYNKMKELGVSDEDAQRSEFAVSSS